MNGRRIEIEGWIGWLAAAPVFGMLLVLHPLRPLPPVSGPSAGELSVRVEAAGWWLRLDGAGVARAVGAGAVWVPRLGRGDAAMLRRSARELMGTRSTCSLRLGVGPGVGTESFRWTAEVLGHGAPPERVALGDGARRSARFRGGER